MRDDNAVVFQFKAENLTPDELRKFQSEVVATGESMQAVERPAMAMSDALESQTQIASTLAVEMEGLAAEFIEIAGNAGDAEKANVSLGKALDRVEAIADAAADQIDEFGRQTKQADGEVDTLNDALRTSEQRVKQTGDAFDDAGEHVDDFKRKNKQAADDTGRDYSAIGGRASTASGSVRGLGDSIRDIREGRAGPETVLRLMQDLSDSALDTGDAVEGKLGGALAKLGTGLTALTFGVGIAIGAWEAMKFVVDKFNESAAESEERLKAIVVAAKEAADARAGLQAALATPDEVAERQDQIEAFREILKGDKPGRKEAESAALDLALVDSEEGQRIKRELNDLKNDRNRQVKELELDGKDIAGFSTVRGPFRVTVEEQIGKVEDKYKEAFEELTKELETVKFQLRDQVAAKLNAALGGGNELDKITAGFTDKLSAEFQGNVQQRREERLTREQVEKIVAEQGSDIAAMMQDGKTDDELVKVGTTDTINAEISLRVVQTVREQLKAQVTNTPFSQKAAQDKAAAEQRQKDQQTAEQAAREQQAQIDQDAQRVLAAREKGARADDTREALRQEGRSDDQIDQATQRADELMEANNAGLSGLSQRLTESQRAAEQRNAKQQAQVDQLTALVQPLTANLASIPLALREVLRNELVKRGTAPDAARGLSMAVFDRLVADREQKQRDDLILSALGGRNQVANVVNVIEQQDATGMPATPRGQQQAADVAHDMQQRDQRLQNIQQQQHGRGGGAADEMLGRAADMRQRLLGRAFGHSLNRIMQDERQNAARHGGAAQRKPVDKEQPVRDGLDLLKQILKTLENTPRAPGDAAGANPSPDRNNRESIDSTDATTTKETVAKADGAGGREAVPEMAAAKRDADVPVKVDAEVLVKPGVEGGDAEPRIAAADREPAKPAGVDARDPKIPDGDLDAVRRAMPKAEIAGPGDDDPAMAKDVDGEPKVAGLIPEEPDDIPVPAGKPKIAALAHDAAEPLPVPAAKPDVAKPIIEKADDLLVKPVDPEIAEPRRVPADAPPLVDAKMDPTLDDPEQTKQITAKAEPDAQGESKPITTDAKEDDSKATNKTSTTDNQTGKDKPEDDAKKDNQQKKTQAVSVAMAALVAAVHEGGSALKAAMGQTAKRLIDAGQSPQQAKQTVSNAVDRIERGGLPTTPTAPTTERDRQQAVTDRARDRRFGEKPMSDRQRDILKHRTDQAARERGEDPDLKQAVAAIENELATAMTATSDAQAESIQELLQAVKRLVARMDARARVAREQTRHARSLTNR